MADVSDGVFPSVTLVPSAPFFVASFFASRFIPAPPLSVLYHPLPLKCTAGGERSFSVFFDLHAGHEGFTFDPYGLVNSNVWPHFWQVKSKVGIGEY